MRVLTRLQRYIVSVMLMLLLVMTQGVTGFADVARGAYTLCDVVTADADTTAERTGAITRTHRGTEFTPYAAFSFEKAGVALLSQHARQYSQNIFLPDAVFSRIRDLTPRFSTPYLLSYHQVFTPPLSIRGMHPYICAPPVC